MENKAFSISRKIGNTLYRANFYYSPTCTESFEDKIRRLIRQEALDFFGGYGIMSPPQVSHQSERSQYGYQAG